jgi:hypothetical protein
LKPVIDPVTGKMHTHVSFIACSDLKGRLPSAICYKLNCRQPEIIKEAKPILMKREQEIEKKDEAERKKIREAQKKLVDVLPVYTDEELKKVLEQTGK